MTPAQTSLFDAPADPLPARSSDPETAKASARRLNLRSRKAEVMAAIGFLYGAVDAPVTADELLPLLRIKRPDYERGWVSSRLAQLARDGLVVAVGVHDGNHGLKVMSFALTPSGRDWLEEEGS